MNFFCRSKSAPRQRRTIFPKFLKFEKNAGDLNGSVGGSVSNDNNIRCPRHLPTASFGGGHTPESTSVHPCLDEWLRYHRFPPKGVADSLRLWATVAMSYVVLLVQDKNSKLNIILAILSCGRSCRSARTRSRSTRSWSRTRFSRRLVVSAQRITARSLFFSWRLQKSSEYNRGF